MRALIKTCGKDIRIQGRLLRIARLEADKYQFLDNPKAVLDGLRQREERIDLFTFMQKPPFTTPQHDYPMEWDNLAVLPITTFEHWWNHQLGFKARNKGKQAEKKGVVVREVPFDDAFVKGIQEIYNECPIRQGRRFKHYGKDINTVYKEEATFLDSSIFAGAFWGDTLIGFTKLVCDETQTQAGLMNIVSMMRHRDKAATNALIAQAVRSCAERRISFLVYSNFAYRQGQKTGISDFKERNGFQRVDLPRYYVPLTRFGWVGFRLGLHHRVVDYFPESLADKVRGVRELWYNRWYQSQTGPV